MKKILFSTIILVIFLCLDYFYGYLTFEFSNSITKYLQNKFEYGKEQGIFEYFLLIFSTAGDAECTNILLLLIWLKANNKVQVLKLISMNVLAASTGNLIKMLMTQPRPFYIDSQIKLDFCYTGYGDPSGHSLRSFVFYVILFETIILRKYDNDSSNGEKISEFNNFNSKIFVSIYKIKYISYLQVKLFMGLFCFLIGIGRLYFGVHFLNQICIGWIAGGYLLYLYYYCGLEEKIFNLFENFNYNSYKLQYMYYFFIISLIYILTFTIYYQRHYNEQLNSQKQIWKQFILKQQQCTNGRGYDFRNKFETHDIQGISIIFFPLYLLMVYHFTIKIKKIDYESILQELKQKIFHILIFILFIQIKKKEKRIISRYSSGSETKRLLLKILFDQFYYIELTILFLIILPLMLKIFKQFFLKSRTYQQFTQIELQDIEVQ